MYAGGRFRNIVATSEVILPLSILPPALLHLGSPLQERQLIAFLFPAQLFMQEVILIDFGGLRRKNVAAVDAVTGIMKDWNPNADDNVYALALSGSTVYVGGSL